MTTVSRSATRQRPRRAIARIALGVGAAGSLGLMLRAGQHTPGFLLILFVFWVLSPFVVLAWADAVSNRFSVATRAALPWSTIVVALGSLAVYGEIFDLRPAGSPNAFLFVIVPPASWLFLAVVVPTVALVSRRLSRRDAGA